MAKPKKYTTYIVEYRTWNGPTLEDEVKEQEVEVLSSQFSTYWAAEKLRDYKKQFFIGSTIEIVNVRKHGHSVLR